MRIRRQPQLNPQATRAENPIDGSLHSPAVVAAKPTSPAQHCAEDIHVSIADLSMIYSASKFRTSVNWLDRLRAAKGFPVDSHRHIEEFLSSRSCSPEHAQSCHLKLDDVACLKHEDTLTAEGGCNGVVDIAAEVFSSNILNTTLPPEALSCSSGNAPVESRHTRSVGKHQALASAENDVAGSKALISLNKGARSRSPSIPSPLSQDSNAEASLSQLYFNVFADLFCIDSCSLNSFLPVDAKKRQRKQEKPKVCSIFADPDSSCAAVALSQLRPSEFDLEATPQLDSGNPTSQSEEAAVVKMDVPSSSLKEEGSENKHVHHRKTTEKVSTDANKKKDEMDLEKGPMNELFVIDTSLPGWRAKKYIIRKGNGWSIRDKGLSAPVNCASAECIAKETPKRPGTPPTINMKNEPSKLQRHCEPSTSCKEKMKNDAAKSGECPISTEHVARLWSTSPHTHMRSSRKRRKTTLPEEAAPKELPETSSTKAEPACTKVELEEKPMAFTLELPAYQETFASDHPANQPKEGIVYSIYQVFMQAGKCGLTPREAVSRILDQGLPGLHEGGVVPRVEVLKVVSNSPYFMPLEESKYILCSALVGDEDTKVAGKQSTQNSEHNDSSNGQNSLDNVKSAKGMSHYWAACAAIRRARTGKTRRKPSLGSYLWNTSTTQEVQNEIGMLSSKKRLKSVKQDVTGLGNPCNRSDGKGWHCPLRAKVGYLLCDHHLDRLRTRVKSHIKSKMLSITKASKDERKRILNGSWMVKKVVERTRIGRPSQVSFEVDAQDKFPINASEMSGSRFSKV